MYKQITIKTLNKQGLKQSEIARQLDCHRHTIANVLSRENFIEKQTRQKGSLFDPYQLQITEWIEKKTSILRMFEILTETYGIKSTYVNLCKYIQAHFPKTKEAFGVQNVFPGEVARRKKNCSHFQTTHLHFSTVECELLHLMVILILPIIITLFRPVM